MNRRLLAVAALVAGSLTACSSFTPAACGGADDTTLGLDVTPPKLVGGLDVVAEPDATETLLTSSEPDATYLCDGAVYALRKKDELRAVFQVTRLAPDARLDDRAFLRNLVGNITGSVPQPVKISDVDVYQIVANEQIISTWFHGNFMFFLTVREDPTIEGVAVDVDFETVLAESIGITPA